MFCDAVGRIVIRRLNEDRFLAETGSCQKACSWVALLIDSWSRPRRSLRQGNLLEPVGNAIVLGPSSRRSERFNSEMVAQAKKDRKKERKKERRKIIMGRKIRIMK